MNTLGTRLLGLAFVLGTAYPSWGAEFVSEFPAGFDGWHQQWHKESPSGTDGIVTHSTERGYLDGASLLFDMGDGLGDDGTLWIEKQFAVSSVYPTHVSVSFQLFNLVRSDLNSFQVKAAISADNPDVQANFDTIGDTNTALGWVPFVYERMIGPTTEPVWVALGIRVAWETHREFWIDRVVVKTTMVPEPSGAVLGTLLLPLSLLARCGRQTAGY